MTCRSKNVRVGDRFIIPGRYSNDQIWVVLELMRVAGPNVRAVMRRESDGTVDRWFPLLPPLVRL